jgi:hypothetical protein
MPSVMNAPARMVYEERTLSDEQPQARATHPGFWHTVMASVRRQSVHRLCRTPALHGPMHRMETAADLLAREYPTLYIRAYAGI